MTPKATANEIGDLELVIPRNRNGPFMPMLVPKGLRHPDGLAGMIISLYAGGMTLRGIQHRLASTIGTELSHETISKITDQVGAEVLVQTPPARETPSVAVRLEGPQRDPEP